MADAAATPTAVPTRWPTCAMDPATPPSVTGISASVSVWVGEITKPAPTPATSMAAAIAHGVTSCGVRTAARSSSVMPTATIARPITTSCRPRRETRRPPIQAVTADDSANGMLTMPANTGARPSPCWRYSVVSRKTAGMAAKYAVAMRIPLRYEESVKSAKCTTGDFPDRS